MLETFVVAEIIKSYWHNGKEAPIFFYRDRDKLEIDVLIEHDGRLYPIEIKKTGKPAGDCAGVFAALDKLDMPVEHGALICLKERHTPITNRIDAVPVGYL
jgi:predicted AAA+ superfamily ATPase